VRLWKWASLFIVTSLLENMEEHSYSAAFERQENFLLFREISYEELEKYIKTITL
jgi:hypothetical protein